MEYLILLTKVFGVIFAYSVDGLTCLLELSVSPSQKLVKVHQCDELGDDEFVKKRVTEIERESTAPRKSLSSESDMDMKLNRERNNGQKEDIF